MQLQIVFYQRHLDFNGKEILYRLQREFTGFEWASNGLWKATTQNTLHTIYFKSEMQPTCICVYHQVQGVFISRNLTFQFYGLLTLTNV